MPAIFDENYLYFNTGEQYKNNSWSFKWNHKNTASPHVSNCIEKSGLICMVSKIAFTSHGVLLPDSFSIWVPKDLLQSEQIEKYYKIYEKLGDLYKQKLYEKGVVPDGYFTWDKPCYLGCEQEYGFIIPDNF